MNRMPQNPRAAGQPLPLLDLLSELQVVIDRHAAAVIPQLRPLSATTRDVQCHLKERRMRDQFFDRGLFADPVWDMLLDLWVARASGRLVSVSSLCIASAVPPTTALRWIERLASDGYVLRSSDPRDSRRRHVSLSPHGNGCLSRYFTAVVESAA